MLTVVVIVGFLAGHILDEICDPLIESMLLFFDTHGKEDEDFERQRPRGLTKLGESYVRSLIKNHDSFSLRRVHPTLHRHPSRHTVDNIFQTSIRN